VSTSSQRAGSSRRSYALEILLVSFAALLLEISYTRVISFKLFYYYTYLVIGLALLGIGCGGVIVTVSRGLRRAETETILRWGLLLGAASVGVGYLIVATVRTDTLTIWDYGTLSSLKNLALLFGICLALLASFIAIGVMIATLFARQTERIGRLYFADLVGAGIACAPATIFLAGLVLALAGLRLSISARSRAFLPVLGLGAVAAMTKHPREYVAWGWAVNGFASVIGAVLTTILAMALGFGVVLALALVVYCGAVLALRGLLRPGPAAVPGGGAEVPVPGALTGVARGPSAAPVPGGG
jgi:hypothetical protein